jgi:hypothetical protein
VRGPEGGRGTALRPLGAPVVGDVRAASGGSVRERDLRVPADDERVRVGRSRTLRAPCDPVCATRGTRLAEAGTLTTTRKEGFPATTAPLAQMREQAELGMDVPSGPHPLGVLRKLPRVRARVAAKLAPVTQFESTEAVGADARLHAARFPRRGFVGASDVSHASTGTLPFVARSIASALRICGVFTPRAYFERRG